jgi:hypothetical protein
MRVQPFFDDLMIKSVDNGRMAFRIRSQLVKDFPGKCKNRMRGTENYSLACQDCGGEETMTQSHGLACPAQQGWS